MSWRLLLDENMEYEIEQRLRKAGFDVQHAARVGELGEGTDDGLIAEYSRDTERFIVTYDDDFLSEFSDAAYTAVLFVPDESLSPAAVERIVDNMAQHYPFDEVEGIVHAGAEWL